MYCISSRGQLVRTGLLAWWLGWRLTTLQSRKPECYEMLHTASIFAGSCEEGNEPLGAIKGREFTV
jgi:hypothetical protein